MCIHVRVVSFACFVYALMCVQKVSFVKHVQVVSFACFVYALICMQKVSFLKQLSLSVTKYDFDCEFIYMHSNNRNAFKP
jgi:hypothetical protein